jgi:hypothetical protein
MMLHYWHTLDDDTRACLLSLFITCSSILFLAGWCFADEKRQRQIMAIATLFAPVTILLSPVIVAAVMLYGIGKGIEWLIGTAAGEQ